MTNRLYIGIDASIRSSGIAICDDSRMLYVYNLPLRECDAVSEIVNKIDAIVKFDAPDEVYAFAEEMQRSPNVDTLRKLNKLLGQLQMGLFLKGINLEFCKPSEWRAHYGFKGKREELKKQAMQYCDAFNLNYKNDDEAEAQLIALYARHLVVGDNND